MTPGDRITDEQIEERIERLAAGDSNDAEIDGLLEIVRELQEERREPVEPTTPEERQARAYGDTSGEAMGR